MRPPYHTHKLDLHALVDASPVALVVVDRHGMIVHDNGAARTLFGCRAGELLGQPVELLLPARLRAGHRRMLDSYMAAPTPRPMGHGRELCAQRRDGSEFAAEISLGYTETLQGPLVAAMIVDVSERRAAQESVARGASEQAALARLSEAALEGADFPALTRRAVEAVCAHLRVERASVVELAQDGEALDGEGPEAGPGIATAIHHSGRRVGVLTAHADGERAFSTDEARFLQSVASVLAHALAQRALAERLREQALRDPLTQLGNRALFLERLQHWLVRAARVQERAAVMFLDLDNFKEVNDSLGHEAGDGVLHTVAERIAGSLRDGTTVARLGGDEFGILLEALRGTRDVLVVAGRIQRALEVPIVVGGHDFRISASMGVALSWPRAPGADELLRSADAAMYEAKRSGPARVRIFDRGMHAAVVRRLEWEHRLREAIDGGELRVLFQPVVTIEDGGVTGFEALVRWARDGELVAPARFIPLADETGLIFDLGRAVLDAACAEAAGWDAAETGVSVNVSARQLAPRLVEDVAQALAGSGLEAHRLAVEVPESALAGDAAAARAVLPALHDLGVRLVLDDFGAGGASLSSLRDFAFDTVKLDRNWVAAIDRRADNRALVAGVTALAAGLGIHSLAEGIEHADELEAVRAAGCRFAQGFYFAPPLEPAAAARLLAGGLTPELRA